MSKTYEALPGVEWVNGQPVPEDREIKLTAKEALFDLAQGRIKLKDEVADGAEPASTPLPAPTSTPPAPKRR